MGITILVIKVLGVDRMPIKIEGWLTQQGIDAKPQVFIKERKKA
jgi:hypothetical protein